MDENSLWRSIAESVGADVAYGDSNAVLLDKIARGDFGLDALFADGEALFDSDGERLLAAR